MKIESRIAWCGTKGPSCFLFREFSGTLTVGVVYRGSHGGRRVEWRIKGVVWPRSDNYRDAKVEYELGKQWLEEDKHDRMQEGY